MTTTYDLIRHHCGLSHREAADFHDVSDSSVASWCSGRRTAPPGAIIELRDLYRSIERAAVELADSLNKRGEHQAEICLSSDDDEAKSIGFPCVGAHAATIGLAATKTYVKIIVVQN